MHQWLLMHILGGAFTHEVRFIEHLSLINFTRSYRQKLDFTAAPSCGKASIHPLPLQLRQRMYVVVFFSAALNKAQSFF